MSPTLAAGAADRDRGTDRYQRRRPEQTLLYRTVERRRGQVLSRDYSSIILAPWPDHYA